MWGPGAGFLDWYANCMVDDGGRPMNDPHDWKNLVAGAVSVLVALAFVLGYYYRKWTAKPLD